MDGLNTPMPRSGNIENPTKVTLYMPQETVERGKKYATKTGRSLSQLVTSLVEKEVGDEIPVTVKFHLVRWEKLREAAWSRGMSLENYVQTIVEQNQPPAEA